MSFPLRCEIVKNNRIFSVTGSPSNYNINEYIKYLKSKSIGIVIKLNEKDLYDTSKFKQNNIEFIHIEIQDGNIPSKDDIIKINKISNEYNSICMHCTAGLGRAPLVLALIMILQFDQDPHDTAIEIRKKIPDCLNKFQIEFLTEFKRKHYVKKKGCELM
jgi:protein tyrosine phosphatase type 4A